MKTSSGSVLIEDTAAENNFVAASDNLCHPRDNGNEGHPTPARH